MIKVVNVNCEQGIPTLEDNSVDLVVTSPPYNVDLGNNKYNKNPYNLYNDNKEHKDYIEWLETIFGLLYKKLKAGGRVCINIGDGKQGRVPTHSDIIQMMCSNIGYLYFSTIIWNKNQVGNRTAWGSWKSPSCPSFPTPFEFILIFSKGDVKLLDQGESDLTDEEFKNWSLSMWTVAPEIRMKKIGHPAMFPEEIPTRLIKMLSWKNSLVVDPFNGAGTTAVACKKLGRDYVGFEISEEYCKITNERLSNQPPQDELDIFS